MRIKVGEAKTWSFGNLKVSLCYTNWTFGPYYGNLHTRVMWGLDLGPLEISYVRMKKR